MIIEKPVWTDETVDIGMIQNNGFLRREELLKNEIATPVEVFEKFFDNEVMQLICEETHRYANQKNNHLFSITHKNIKMFLGFLLLSGYHRFPERNYTGTVMTISVFQQLGIVSLVIGITKSKDISI